MRGDAFEESFCENGERDIPESGETDRPLRVTEREFEAAFDEAELYDRPAHFRAGVRDEVWENAKDEHGRVRDPVTGRYMSKEQPWHMGHRPGYEFAKHRESAMKRGISREQFLDEYNDASHYRPELPLSNMSHKGESRTENYYLESEET